MNTSFTVARIDALLPPQAQQKRVGGKRHISKAGQDGISFQKELIRNDLYDFRKTIGIPDKHGEPFTKRQEEANSVVGDLYDLVIRSRRLM